MSVVIIGGNECMERQYKDICREYSCRARVFTKMTGSFRDKLGAPDLLVLFTNTMSHKMMKSAISETKGSGTVIERCHSSSATALKLILDRHTAGAGG